MYTTKGKIKMIGATQQVSDSFKKRELVLEIEGKYPQFVSFEFAQERADLLNNYKTGQEVELTFFLRGREYKSPKDGSIRYFNSLDGWKIESALESAGKKIDNRFPEDEGDGLPF